MCKKVYLGSLKLQPKFILPLGLLTILETSDIIRNGSRKRNAEVPDESMETDFDAQVG
jgi:hypothetical protein